MNQKRSRSDCQRLALRSERGRRHSWFSAALHGRLTGSGAVFSGEQGDPWNVAEAQVKKAAADAVASGAHTTADALNNVGNKASAYGQAQTVSDALGQVGAALSTPLGMGTALVVGYFLLKNKD